MKTKTIVIVASAFASLAFAQDPSPTPAPIKPAIQVSTQARAAVAAARLATQINSTLVNVQRVMEKGLPAQGDGPAITGDDIKAALGPANVVKIQAAMNALTGAPSGTATPKPKK